MVSVVYRILFVLDLTDFKRIRLNFLNNVFTEAHESAVNGCFFFALGFEVLITGKVSFVFIIKNIVKSDSAVNWRVFLLQFNLVFLKLVDDKERSSEEQSANKHGQNQPYTEINSLDMPVLPDNVRWLSSLLEVSIVTKYLRLFEN